MTRQIGLDVRMIRHTGIGTYLRGLLQGFAIYSPANKFNLHCYGTLPSLPDQAGSFEIHPFDARIYSLAEQWRYPKLLKSCSLWHAPHYNIPYLKGSTQLVVTVHDLIHWIYRKEFFTPLQAFYAETMFRRVAKTADHMIAVSKSTAADLVKYFDADAQKISVIYEAAETPPPSAPSKSAEVLRRWQLPEKFFLYVGSIKPHKNVQTLLRVFRKLRKTFLKSALVIVGKKDRAYVPEWHDLEHLQTGDGIWYFPEMNREDLWELYRVATALVHLSLYEGFGLTPLEAMACGTPVIASHCSSLPEVVGDAGILVDPRDEKQIAEALRQIEEDAALRESLRRKGAARISQFSWEKTAHQTLDVYQKVLNQ